MQYTVEGKTFELCPQETARDMQITAEAVIRLLELLASEVDETLPLWQRQAAVMEIPHVARLCGFKVKTGEEV